MTLESKILSIKDSLQGSYVKPDPERLVQFRKALSESSEAKDYLFITRGLSQDTVDYFNLGYDPEKNAIVIPVFKRGELINLRYRNLDPNAKAKYVQEKGCEVWLFHEEGIESGKPKGGVLVVEGEFDCMSAWQAGFKNVISPASGKDSYGIWIELLDSIPKVYIAYDNDKPGKAAAIDLAERVGTDKSFEVIYPEGIKDANDYFKEYDAEAYRVLLKAARPFYKYKFAGVVDVISSLRERNDNFLKLDCIPFIEWEESYTAVISGVTNIGKTSVAMNVANELAEKGIPVLVLPIERGIKDVGKRFLQVRYEKTKDELRHVEDKEWEERIIPDVLNLPIYFSMPKVEEVSETVIKAKRLFGTKFVIVDHLDLFVRKADPKSYNVELAATVQMLVRLAQENSIIFLLVHHIRKQEGVGAIPKKPSLNDLKGSGSVKDDPEAVIMLSEPDKGQIEVDILKNKGEMGSRIYEFNLGTGRIGRDITETRKATSLDDF